MRATFTATNPSPLVTRYICNETGTEFEIITTGDGHNITMDGKLVAHRQDRSLALTYIEQEANLGLRVAQSVSAFS